MADSIFAQIHMSYAELNSVCGAIRNRRYYFKVHACNTATQSADSMTVYVDIPG